MKVADTDHMSFQVQSITPPAMKYITPAMHHVTYEHTLPRTVTLNG